MSQAVAPAAAAVAPTAAQRSAANDLLQEGVNNKFVDLVQTKDGPREVGGWGMRRFRGFCLRALARPFPPSGFFPSHSYVAFRHPGRFGFPCAHKENTPPAE